MWDLFFFHEPGTPWELEFFSCLCESLPQVRTFTPKQHVRGKASRSVFAGVVVGLKGKDKGS